MWKVKIAQYAQDKLEAIPAQHRLQISVKIQARLSQKPLPDGKITKKLESIKTSDGRPIYRLRAGRYRVLYLIMAGQQVYVLDIVSRSELKAAIKRFAQ